MRSSHQSVIIFNVTISDLSAKTAISILHLLGQITRVHRNNGAAVNSVIEKNIESYLGL